MNLYKGANFFFVLLALIILLPIISPFSITSHVNAKSDQGEESSSNKGNNGKGHDNGDDGDDARMPAPTLAVAARCAPADPST